MGLRINIELDEPAAIESILDKVFDRIEKRDRTLAEIDAAGEASRLDHVVKTFEKLPAILAEAMKALHPPVDESKGFSGIPRRGPVGVGGVVPFPGYKAGPPSEQDLADLSAGGMDGAPTVDAPFEGLFTGLSAGLSAVSESGGAFKLTETSQEEPAPSIEDAGPVVDA